MKNKIFIFLCLFIFIANLSFAQTKSILFLGNSLTYSNGGLQNELRSLALSLGDTLEVDANNTGGATFSDHCNNATSLAKIQSRAWDYVVLQGQSQEPSFPPLQVQQDTYPYAAILSDSVHNNSACTQLLFFMSWGRPNGDTQNCASYPVICTYDGIQGRLRTSYLEMAEANDGWAVPCGMAFSEIFHNHPEINLFSDAIHPSMHGTYLAACTFYASIFHKSPVGASYIPAGITQNEATLLQTTAWNTVNDSVETWLIDTTTLNPSFQVLSSYYDNACFKNTTENADSCTWTLVGGYTSTQYPDANGKFDNLYYTFPMAEDTYNICLTAYKNCEEQTVCDTVIVSLTETPYVDINLLSATYTELEVSFTPSPTCGSYYYLCGIHSEMENWTNLFDTATISGLVKAWGIDTNTFISHTFDELIPNTEYTIYVVPIDTADVEFDYIVSHFNTLMMGGTGVSQLQISIPEITLTTANVVVTKNSQTAVFHDGLITLDYFNEIGQDSAITVIKTNEIPLYENDDWIWQDLDPATSYKAIAIGKNALDVWGEPTIVEFSTLTTELNDIKNNRNFTVYPNPNNGIFNINTTDLKDAYEIEVLNIYGSVVCKINLTSDIISIDLTNQTKGLYLINILDSNKQMLKAEKVIVE